MNTCVAEASISRVTTSLMMRSEARVQRDILRASPSSVVQSHNIPRPCSVEFLQLFSVRVAVIVRAVERNQPKS
ncbi:hypothetical protein MPTK2_3g19340 [Marchantia polymorpha subsp. ruderalis]